MLKFIKKTIIKDIKNMPISEAYLNIKLENKNTPNQIKKKYKDTNHEIALYETDLEILKPLYKKIYKDNNYDKNNSFILALCILLISKIINKPTYKIMEGLNII